ncbi:MAG: peptide deformylase [Bacillota bacterium]|nr:MAG: peptide deformylase [Bacillota bacterium]
MAIRIVREKGDPVLREHTATVKRFDETLARLVEDMFETMYHYNGVGLAAPQIAIPKSIIVLDAGDGERYALINPKIVLAEGHEVGVEGCLSVPGVYGEVERYSQIRVHAQDLKGELLEIEATEFLARVLQHELDHLQGVLFVDKVIRYLPEEELADE